MLNNIRRSDIENIELWNLIIQIQKLTDGDYSLYDANAPTLKKLLDRVLFLAKQEKQWHLYFKSITEIVYLLKRMDEEIKALKYVEIYYKDSKQYMEEALLSDNAKDIGEENVCICAEAFDIYLEFPQITDEKLDQFMKLYKDNVTKYGSKGNYYGDLLDVAIFNRDKEMLRIGKEGLDHNEFMGCYICHVKPVFGYYIFDNNLEGVEELIHRILTKNIPRKKLWSYRMCEHAKEDHLICDVLEECLLLGNEKMFHIIFEKYKKVFQEGEADWTVKLLFCTLSGNWSSHGENDIDFTKRAYSNIEKQKSTAFEKMWKALFLYCYYQMLDAHGVHKVLELEDTFKKESGCSCIEISNYFEQKADEIGTQMMASRRHFDYSSIKQTFEVCFLEKKKI